MSTKGKNKPQPRSRVCSEMMSFRLPAGDRIELYKLANKRRQPVSEVMRDLIMQATAKSAPAVGAQSSNGAAKKTAQPG